MTTAKLLVTIDYRLDAAKNFVSSISNNPCYFFVSNHIDANNAVRPFDNQQDTLNSSYQGMIFGKKIQSNDSVVMIRRIEWSSNTIYDIYDHRDLDLYDSNFYTIVHEGTQWDVFKCLENGSGAPSTVAPSRTNVNISGSDFYFPTDGYRWKYMYSISDSDEAKFGTTDYFPVVSDANTVASAMPGSIDAIIVESPGRGYNNYFSGSFSVGDIRLNGDPKKYGISDSGINTTNGYYEGCWLYISSGPGAGQYRMINTYVSNATHNYVVLNTEFDSADLPKNGSLFEISPSVSILGDGRQTAPAYARAIIDSNSNTVQRIEMIEHGLNYYHADASVVVSPTVGITSQASITPIMSPFTGHGSNPPSELGGKFACVAVTLDGSEHGTIITDNDYSQIGIVKNPLFNNIQISIMNQNREFFTEEVVYSIETSQLSGSAQTLVDGNNALTDTLSISNVDATQIVNVGSTILINWSTNYQLANVVSVTSSSIKMDAPALWNTGSATANIYLTSVNGSGLVSAFSAGIVDLTNCTGTFESGDILIGSETGVHATANVVTVNGSTKTFDTFIAAYTYIGTIDQGVFTPDEVIYQIDNPDANARFHSSVFDANTGISKIYTTNQFNVFNTAADNFTGSSQIKGSLSGAIATLSSKILPDIIYGSGEVLYLEYGDSITRSAENTETFQLVFAF